MKAKRILVLVADQRRRVDALAHTAHAIDANPLAYFDVKSAEISVCNLEISRTPDAAAIKARNSSDAIVVTGDIIGDPTLDHSIEFWRASRLPMILWGGGVSSPVSPGNMEDYQHLRAFALIGLRDWGLGFRWVPPATCLDSVFSGPAPGGKGIAIVLSRLSSLKAVGAESLPPHADMTHIDTIWPAKRQIGAISQAEFIVTDSYDAAYWATLLGKRVIAIEGGAGIHLLKHTPIFAQPGNWGSAIERSLRYPAALEECRDTNIDFAGRVTKLVAAAPAAAPFVRDPIQERSDEIIAPAATRNSGFARHLVPRILHFVFFGGGEPFNLMHQIAVLSAVDKIKPEQAFFYYRHLSDSPEFEAVRGYLTLRKLPPADKEAPMHFAHQTDLLRLQLLHDEGGIYLDLDTVTVKGFDQLLVHPFTIGIQGRTLVDGLCNATLLAQPRNAFVRGWLDAYARFTDEWDLFSVRLPYVMWRSGRWVAHVEPYSSFHWPTWRNDGLKAMFEQDIEFPAAYSHHLWESRSYPLYFGGRSAGQMLDRIKNGRSTYARLARPYF